MIYDLVAQDFSRAGDVSPKSFPLFKSHLVNHVSFSFKKRANVCVNGSLNFVRHVSRMRDAGAGAAHVPAAETMRTANRKHA